MAIFHPPIQATHVGGAQPYAPKVPYTPTGVAPHDDPPFSNEATAAANLSIIDLWKEPPPHAFMGRWQALDPAKLNPDFLNVPITEPPFQHPGRSVQIAAVIALNQPDTWPMVFIGGTQPYAPYQTYAERLRIPIDNPPFTVRGRTVNNSTILQASQSGIDAYVWGGGAQPWPYAFAGNRQPYEPAKLPADFLAITVNNPPPAYGGLTSAIAIACDLWRVADPLPMMGGREPLKPRYLPISISAVPENNPPFTRRMREIASQLRNSWEPPPPNPFMGAWQALEHNQLPPSVIDVPINEPPYTWQIRVGTLASILATSQPPPPNPFMGGRQPLQPGKIPPSLISIPRDNPPIQRRFNWQSINAQWEVPPQFAPGYQGSTKITSVVPQMSLQMTYVIIITG